jgi:hypothetical protein
MFLFIAFKCNSFYLKSILADLEVKHWKVMLVNGGMPHGKSQLTQVKGRPLLNVIIRKLPPVTKLIRHKNKTLRVGRDAVGRNGLPYVENEG